MTATALRRFDTIRPGGHGITLRAGHPATVEARTMFPSRVFHSTVLPRLLKSGHNSRKIGKMVTKGKWRGFPIYTLTLQERATCPASCAMWLGCYGNNMHFAERIIADEAFERRLWSELAALNQRHPGGFAVRLHVLGDFYSERYVRIWRAALARFKALHVFGFTARDPREERIGAMLFLLAVTQWDRFAIRFSNMGFDAYGAQVDGEPTAAIACPAQTGATDCCATCGLCWATTRNIAFARH